MQDNDSVFSDSSQDDSCSQDSQNNLIDDPMNFFKKCASFKEDTGQNIKKDKLRNDTKRSTFHHQFDTLKFDNPSTPVSANNARRYQGNDALVKNIEDERNLALAGKYSMFEKDKDMTYKITDQKDFMHNNMIPHFKRGFGKGNAYNSPINKSLNNFKQRKLETFTGSINNANWKPRSEQKPLFNPMIGLTNIYGMPNFTDQYRSRYVPKKERQGEKPFQPIRVTPGLGLNYNEVSKQGFHDTYRVMPKTTNQLRTLNNPKISYSKHVNYGMKGEKRGVVAGFKKNLPETFFENSTADLQKSIGYHKAPTVYKNYDAPPTNRSQTSSMTYNHAKSQYNLPTPGQLQGKHRAQTKIATFNDPTRNITNTHQKNTSLTQNTYNAAPTMRSMTGDNVYLNPGNYHEGNKTQAYNRDNLVPNATMRQLTQDKTYINPGNLHEGNKSQGYNRNNLVPNATMRQLTQDKTYLAPSNLHEGNKSQGYNRANLKPATTMRQLTQDKTYLAPSNLHEGNKSQGYNRANLKPATTMRQLTQDKTYLNPSNLHEGNKSQGYNRNNLKPATTMRQLTQDKTYLAPSNLHEGNKSQGYNRANLKPATTLRQLTQDKTYLAPSNLHEGNKSQGYNRANLKPATTMRQLTQDKTYLNPSNLHEGNKSQGYNRANLKPATTLRQLTQDKTYLAPSNLHEGNKSQGYNRANLKPATTLRQLTQNKTYLNPSKQHDATRGAYKTDQNNTQVKTTLKQTTQNKTYLNPSKQHEATRGAYKTDQDNTQAKTTLKQTTQNKTYLNPANRQDTDKQRTRDDAYNGRVNVGKDLLTIVRDGGAPTPSNYTKIPTYGHTSYHLKDPIQTNRDIYGDLHQENTYKALPSKISRHANIFPNHNDMINENIINNLQGNPYINNVVHVSDTESMK